MVVQFNVALAHPLMHRLYILSVPWTTILPLSLVLSLLASFHFPILAEPLNWRNLASHLAGSWLPSGRQHMPPEFDVVPASNMFPEPVGHAINSLEGMFS